MEGYWKTSCTSWKWWFIPLFVGFQPSFWWCRISSIHSSCGKCVILKLVYYSRVICHSSVSLPQGTYAGHEETFGNLGEWQVILIDFVEFSARMEDYTVLSGLIVQPPRLSAWSLGCMSHVTPQCFLVKWCEEWALKPNHLEVSINGGTPKSSI